MTVIHCMECMSPGCIGCTQGGTGGDMSIAMECYGCGEQWDAMPEMNRRCPKCHITSVGRHEAPPAEPTTAETFALLREALECVRRDKFPAAFTDGMKALALLERRMQGRVEFEAIWKAVLPYLPPKARDDAHADMLKALADV